MFKTRFAFLKPTAEFKKTMKSLTGLPNFRDALALHGPLPTGANILDVITNFFKSCFNPSTGQIGLAGAQKLGKINAMRLAGLRGFRLA